MKYDEFVRRMRALDPPSTPPPRFSDLVGWHVRIVYEPDELYLVQETLPGNSLRLMHTEYPEAVRRLKLEHIQRVLPPPVPANPPEKKSEHRKTRKIMEERGPILIGVTLLLLVGVIGCSVASCKVVDPGHVGIKVWFGEVQPTTLSSGPHMVWPLYSIEEWSIQTVEQKETMETPTSEGMVASLDVSVLYALDPNKVVELYKNVGKGYITTIVEPYARNAVRDVMAGFRSEDLYTETRTTIEQKMNERLRAEYERFGIRLEAVLLRDVRLPPEVKAAIDRKIAAKQGAEQMQFTIQRERQEAERRKVEAEGIAIAQKTIADSLTPEYLQWKYIDSLKELVNSPNNTVILLPFDQKLTPILPIPGAGK